MRKEILEQLRGMVPAEAFSSLEKMAAPSFAAEEKKALKPPKADKAPKAAKPLSPDECLSCHGCRNDIAGRTDHLELNPHNSPHYGMDLDCELCHHLHQKSEDYCAQCHDADHVVP